MIILIGLGVLILIASSQNARDLVSGLFALVVGLPVAAFVLYAIYTVASRLAFADWCLIVPVAALLGLYVYRAA